ncbi:hypothetical protein F4813DRAFT_221334 [Daldinia decipiens]|uniref:uncharacterized protein n=1 Tax=Daldinia decipiens TaxID=326647 RepID=UPI0020C302BF|nr:uncharacterized protein F4813DRAFT_221334 [Daldinia decipiens]KAI1661217.1 hypothetical protein F4813DRAFT_221334 [Daldinia decipiens]
MRSFALAALPRARGASKIAISSTTASIQSLATRRTFSSLPTLRPTLHASPGSVFRTPNRLPLQPFGPPTAAAAAAGATADLVPKTSLTTHPWLSGAAQVRFGPRPTMARTSRLVRKRRHGFLSRVRSHNGRKTLQRRREKKRSTLSN